MNQFLTCTTCTAAVGNMNRCVYDSIFEVVG